MCVKMGLKRIIIPLVPEEDLGINDSTMPLSLSFYIRNDIWCAFLSEEGDS